MENSTNDNKTDVSSLGYVSPRIETIEVLVEQGYAGSQLPERIPEFW